MTYERAIEALRARRESLLASLGAELLDASVGREGRTREGRLWIKEMDSHLDALDELLSGTPRAHAIIEELCRRAA